MAFAATVALLAWACRREAPGGVAKPPILTVLIWPDYVSPEIVRKFEQENKCTVRLEIFTSNEDMQARLDDGRTKADVIVPSSYVINRLQPELAKLDDRLLPNRRNIDEAGLANLSPQLAPGKFREVAVPYLVAPTGIAFMPSPEVPEGVISKTTPDGMKWIGWHSLTQRLGRSSLLNDKREALAAVMLALSLPADSLEEAHLVRAEEQLRKWCEGGLRLNGTTYHHLLLARKHRVIAQAYLGDILPLEQKGVTFALPDKGFVITCDYLAIPRSAPNPQLAHKFIDYLCQEEVSAKNMVWTLYRAPNRPGFQRAREMLLLASKESSPAMHPALGLLEATWAKEGCVLPPLTAEQETRLDQLWGNFVKYREE